MQKQYKIVKIALVCAALVLGSGIGYYFFTSHRTQPALEQRLDEKVVISPTPNNETGMTL